MGGTYAGDTVLDKTDCGRALTTGGGREVVGGWAAAEGRFEPRGRGLLICVMRGGDATESRLCAEPLGDVGKRLEAAYVVGES